jgi:hypothetical protein
MSISAYCDEALSLFRLRTFKEQVKTHLKKEDE